MVEPNSLEQVKEIIAYLKEQNENKASSPAVIVSGILQEYHNDFQHKIDSSLIVCKPKSKEKPVLIQFSNLTQDKGVVNRDEEIQDIINTLKAKKEQSIDKTVANSDVLQKNSDNVSFTNLCTKKAEESVLTNGGEILRKYKSNYLQKHNNKRYKISDNNDNKQLCLNQFYNVVKSANTCQNEREFNSKLEDHTEKNKNLDPVIRNSEENKKSLDYTHAEGENTLFSFQSNQKLKEIKVWDIFHNIKKRNEVPQHFNRHIRKREHLKENTPKQTGKSGITLDDFFKNIIGNRNKTEKGCAMQKASENTENNFLKSFSTGNITGEKEKHKETNSVPVTNYEIKHVKEKLENSTKTLDEVIEKILKNINNGENSENIESKIKDNFEHKLEKYIDEEPVIQQNDCSKGPTATHNSQLFIIDSLIGNTEYINLSCDSKIREYNQDSDSCKYSIRDSKKNEALNQENKPDFILKEEPRKEYNLIEATSLIKQQKESRDRNKENIIFKSFSNRNIVTEKADYKNTDSIIIASDEKQNVNKRLEDNTSNFDDVMERILTKIKSDENSDKSKIHSCGDENSEKNTFLGNEREKSSNENIVISESIRHIDCNKNLQLSQHEEKSFKFYFHTTEPLIENKNCNLASKINFIEHGQHLTLEKDSVKDYFDNFSQDIEMYYSHFTQKYTDSAGNQDINPIDGLNLDSEKQHSTKETEADFTNGKEEGIEEFCKCKDTNCSENNTDIASLREEIDLLENKLEKSILLATYRKQTKKTKENEINMEAKKPFKLEDFLKNLIPSIEKKECKRNISCKNKIFVKKYRKGKIKIYKLKKLRKKCLETETEDVNEDVTFQDLLKKISCGNSETKPRMSKFKSGSSISTSSSYITDDTKSEILSTGSKELTSPQQRLRYGFNELSKDKTLRYSENEWEEVPEHTKEDIKMKIQDVFFQILEDFKNKRSSFFQHRKQSFDNCIFKNGRLQIKPMEESSMTIINSQAQRSKAKFQLMLYIMKKIQTLLETNTKLTKRELYYQLKELISDQRVSDRAINAISCVLDVGMWALNIIAQKGLVFGDLKLLLSSGEILNCNIPGTLIPQDVNDIVEVHSAAYFILVVEKESIFHKLIQEDLPNKLTRPFIMITGKGFPDLNTQLFLRKLWTVMSIPVFILVDADPHGINIMLNYRFGSVNNAHVSQHLAVPNAKWLGVYPSEVINLNIARQPLSEREVKLVNRILQTPYMEFSLKLVDELRVLSTKKFKASIEGLIKTDRYLSDVYLPNKFFAHNFI